MNNIETIIDIILVDKYNISNTNIAKYICNYILLIERGDQYNWLQTLGYVVNNCDVENIDRTDWDHIIIVLKPTELFIREFRNKLNWYYVSKYQILSEAFIDEFNEHIYWEILYYKGIYSNNFIDKYSTKLNWDKLSRYIDLSENFMDTYGHKINWYHISYNHNLTEYLIEKYSSRLNWYQIFSYRKISIPFMFKFRNKITPYNVYCFNYWFTLFESDFKIKFGFLIYDNDVDIIKCIKIIYNFFGYLFLMFCLYLSYYNVLFFR